MVERAIPNSGDSRVDAALARIREKFAELEDAMLVQVHLEKRAAERTLEHAQLLADHHSALADHAIARRDHDEWVKHFQDKLDALTDIVMRREGGSEART